MVFPRGGWGGSRYLLISYMPNPKPAAAPHLVKWMGLGQWVATVAARFYLYIKQPLMATT
jgi:hypothetical protein